MDQGVRSQRNREVIAAARVNELPVPPAPTFLVGDVFEIAA